VKGRVEGVPKAIGSCTQSDVEVVIEEVWVVSLSDPRLPLQIDDAARPEVDEKSAQVQSPSQTRNYIEAKDKVNE
jgi:aspartyl-tRNA synthetase